MVNNNDSSSSSSSSKSTTSVAVVDKNNSCNTVDGAPETTVTVANTESHCNDAEESKKHDEDGTSDTSPEITIDTKTPSQENDIPNNVSSDGDSPGSGVEESKEEHQQPKEGYTGGRSTCPQADSTDVGAVAGENAPDCGTTKTNGVKEDNKPHPNPLVGYWFWKHTTFNFQQHKMYMHLAKNSDLALHVVLAIIVNQVRSERNHTIFATTGLHPAWFFIDPRNPKAMIN
mmetsp:Transcript_14534/g.26018  ORF Transcript_14534/g.26018 Transcript_14534/m.26018 type:complete len:230 (+) Transcript_14534:131-820(+)